MSGVTVIMMAANITELFAEQWYDVKGSLLTEGEEQDSRGGLGGEVSSGKGH